MLSFDRYRSYERNCAFGFARGILDSQAKKRTKGSTFAKTFIDCGDECAAGLSVQSCRLVGLAKKGR